MTFQGNEMWAGIKYVTTQAHSEENEGQGVKGCHIGLLCPSLTTVNMELSISWQKKFSCPLWSLGAWIMDFHLFSSISTYH